MQTTIEIEGIEFEVEFDYQPEEPMVMYYPDGSGYPGCAASIDINGVTHKGEDFFDLMQPYQEKIEELVWETLYD